MKIMKLIAAASLVSALGACKEASDAANSATTASQQPPAANTPGNGSNTATPAVAQAGLIALDVQIVTEIGDALTKDGLDGNAVVDAYKADHPAAALRLAEDAPGAVPGAPPAGATDPAAPAAGTTAGATDPAAPAAGTTAGAAGPVAGPTAGATDAAHADETLLAEIGKSLAKIFAALAKKDGKFEPGHCVDAMMKVTRKHNDKGDSVSAKAFLAAPDVPPEFFGPVGKSVFEHFTADDPASADAQDRAFEVFGSAPSDAQGDKPSFYEACMRGASDALLMAPPKDGGIPGLDAFLERAKGKLQAGFGDFMATVVAPDGAQRDPALAKVLADATFKASSADRANAIKIRDLIAARAGAAGDADTLQAFNDQFTAGLDGLEKSDPKLRDMFKKAQEERKAAKQEDQAKNPLVCPQGTTSLVIATPDGDELPICGKAGADIPGAKAPMDPNQPPVTTETMGNDPNGNPMGGDQPADFFCQVQGANAGMIEGGQFVCQRLDPLPEGAPACNQIRQHQGYLFIPVKGPAGAWRCMDVPTARPADGIMSGPN